MQKEMFKPSRYPRLCVKITPSNPNHHLWNNNGTWFVGYTVMDTPLTVTRIRRSLQTRDLSDARIRRDQLLEELRKSIGTVQLQKGDLK